MKRTFAILLVASLILLDLLASPNAVSAQDGSEDPCQLADEYLASGLLSFAQTAYENVLAASPAEKCALKGLASMGVKKCAIAEKQVQAGEIESARAAYLAIVADQPDLDCATQGLSALGPATCADADRYLKAGSVSLAEGIYTRIIETHPGENCALAGLVSVAQMRCELAVNQANSGDADGAKNTYNAILAGYPNLACAVDGLAGLSRPAAVIENLVLIGDYDQAWTNLDTALQTGSRNEELEAIAKQPWTVTYKANKLWTAFAGSILSLLGALLAFYLLIRFVTLLVQRSRLCLDVQEFKMDLVSSRLPAGAQLEDLEKRLTIRFEEAFNRMGQTRRVRRPDLIDQPMSALAIPDLSTALPLNVGDFLTRILNAISAMFPPSLIAVSCRLDKDSERGVGIGVKLVHSRQNEVWGADYVWEKDLEPGKLQYQFDPQESIDDELVVKALALVKYAAVVAIWRFFEGKYPRRAKFHLTNAFGTNNHRSHIATYLATELQTKDPDHLEIVEKLLRQALTLDPNNVVALNNLGNLMYQKGNIEFRKNQNRSKAYYSEGREYLDKVIHIRRKKARSTTPCITAKYILGIMEIERENGDLKEAARLLDEAAQHAKRSGDANTMDLVDVIRIPYASAIRASDPAKADKVIAEIIGSAHTNPRVIYNLACYYAAASGDLDLSLRYLERTFFTDKSYVEYSKTDPSLEKLRASRKREYESLLEKFSDCTGGRNGQRAGATRGKVVHLEKGKGF